MEYKDKHGKKAEYKPLNAAFRSFIATLCAILIIISGYIAASYFDGGL